MSTTRYRLHIVKSEIAWAMPVLFGKPSPFLEITLAGQQLYVTKTKPSTITPVWEELLELKSNDPTSLVSINLGRPSMERGPTRSIGSTQLSIEDLEERSIFSSEFSLDLFEKNKKTADVMIRFRKDEPPPPPVVKPEIPVNVPPELRPDFVHPRHPSAPEKRMQYVGYQSQDISMDQAERIIRQILARYSG